MRVISSVIDDALDLFAGSTAGTTTAAAFVPDGDPSFWGGYIEAGYFLTGETRGYKNGMWDRTKVLKPFSKGGWGAVQINGRVDYLDLDFEQAEAWLHQHLHRRYANLHGHRVWLELHQGRQAARPAR